MVVRRAIAFRLPAKMEDLDKLIAPFNFTSGERQSAIDFAKSEEGQCVSLWDLVQGFTAYARGFDYMDARVKLETKAGSLLKLVSNN